MPSRKLAIALAIRDPLEASRIEMLLDDDGYDATVFHTAEELWTSYPRYRPRMIIADRRFGSGFDGLVLSRNIRQHYLTPFVYILLLSRLKSMKEIEEGLDAGVNDYLIKPHHPFQIRSRIRVGLRWLEYVDHVSAKASKA